MFAHERHRHARGVLRFLGARLGLGSLLVRP
jgi:hypothetical protein